MSDTPPDAHETVAALASALVRAGRAGSGGRLALPHGSASGSVTPFMDRRAFIGTLAGGLLAAPLAAEAQQAGKVYRIGILSLNPIDPASPGILDGFFRGLRERGWMDGKNVILEYRDAGGRADRLRERARELVALNVDLIVAYGPPDIEAAMHATRTIPIVMGVHSGDPVRAGFIASLSRPGGNVTGVSSVTPELITKRVELLREVRSGIVRVAVLWDLAAGPVDRMESVRPGSNAAAKAFGIRWYPIPVRVPQDFPMAFEIARRERVEGMIFGPDTRFLRDHLPKLSAFAVTYRLPTVADRDVYAEGGILMAYGPDLHNLFARAAHHVDKIFRGASPAELPVEQPTKFELVINLKTAKAIGLTIPPALLQRADQVL